MLELVEKAFHAVALFIFKQGDVKKIKFPAQFDAVITSQLYMNALDYGRDNRLRLWFINPQATPAIVTNHTSRRNLFVKSMESLAEKIEQGLSKKGHCIFVVGEKLRGSVHPSEVVASILHEKAPSLKLKKILSDDIPDVRRTRRECRGIKTEHILIFQKK